MSAEPSTAPPAKAPSDPPEPSSLALAADFPAATRDEWRELVSAVLAKSGVDEASDPEQMLTYRTYDDIDIRPLYTAADAPAFELAGQPGHPPFVRGATQTGATVGGWDVRVRHAGPDTAAANTALLADLETGATSLWLVVGDGGLAADDLAAALEGVYLDLAPVVLDAGPDVGDALEALLAVAQKAGVAPGELRGSAGADPIGTYVRTGHPRPDTELADLVELVRDHPAMRVATVDATIYHDAGASDAQELGIATAVGVAYLRALTGAGLSVDDALDRVDFRFAVTAEQFPSIAKLRAARRVWDRVAELSGASQARRGQHQHAVTSSAMLTRRDPWVNMLRSTVGCFAAAIGGADAITVTPFDAAIGVSDDFARRVARNTQSVLHDESSLARVSDAAGGSWFVESLTDALAERAWEVFTSIESSGGALAAVESGAVEALVARTRERRADDIAHRRAPITGVSEFAFVEEKAVERPPLPTSAASDDSLLPRLRYAAEFEELRDRADAAARRPRVFLAGLGSLAAASARSAFAANLFQAGGIECVTGTGDADEILAAFGESGTSVVCLCSSDKIYAEQAAPTAAGLRSAGASQIWLAGRFETDGVDDNIYAGCDAVAVVRSVFETLGVT